MMELLSAELREASKARVLAGSVFLKLGRSASYAFDGLRRSDHPFRANDLYLVAETPSRRSGRIPAEPHFPLKCLQS